MHNVYCNSPRLNLDNENFEKFKQKQSTTITHNFMYNMNKWSHINNYFSRKFAEMTVYLQWFSQKWPPWWVSCPSYVSCPVLFSVTMAISWTRQSRAFRSRCSPNPGPPLSLCSWGQGRSKWPCWPWPFSRSCVPGDKVHPVWKKHNMVPNHLRKQNSLCFPCVISDFSVYFQNKIAL